MKEAGRNTVGYAKLGRIESKENNQKETTRERAKDRACGLSDNNRDRIGWDEQEKKRDKKDTWYRTYQVHWKSDMPRSRYLAKRQTWADKGDPPDDAHDAGRPPRAVDRKAIGDTWFEYRRPVGHAQMLIWQAYGQL